MDGAERYCASCGASNQPEDERCFACGSSLNTTANLADEETTSAHILRQRYRLLSQVGSGGFSAVYKAEDLTSKQVVAIKAVSLRGLNSQEKIEATDAFNREVSLLSKLRHRHLPHIYDHFSDTECWYLVMDFITGTTLEKRLSQQHTPLPLEEVLDIGLVLCDVLDYLHGQQPMIIFRDLKPANIMLTTDGHLYLIDFGIARQFKPGQARDTIPFGSPGYAAPEQYGKAQTTPRADIYSLGAILHQLLSGQDPSHTPFAFAPLDTQKGPVFEQLNKLILSMVELNTQNRPESSKIVKLELQRIATKYRQQRGIPVQQPTNTFYQPPVPPWPPISAPGPGYAQPAFAGIGGQTMAGQIQFAAPFTIPYVRNNYAIASLIFSLLGIFLPPFLCFLSSSFFSLLVTRSAYVLLLMPILLIPSLLGIIFGHIGRQRARTIPGMQASADTAMTGMIIGYIFGGIYLVIVLCIIASMLGSGFHP